MTVNIDLSARSRARLHRLPGHSSSVHRDHGPRLKLTFEDGLRLARCLRADSVSPDPRGLAPPRPMSQGWLRLVPELTFLNSKANVPLYQRTADAFQKA